MQRQYMFIMYGNSYNFQQCWYDWMNTDNNRSYVIQYCCSQLKWRPSVITYYILQPITLVIMFNTFPFSEGRAGKWSKPGKAWTASLQVYNSNGHETLWLGTFLFKLQSPWQRFCRYSLRYIYSRFKLESKNVSNIRICSPEDILSFVCFH